jgi:hypothetical protein
VWHWRDWDPADAQPPRAGKPEVRWCHVPCLVQGVRHPLVEVLAAKAVNLMPGGLHLCGVGAVLSLASSAVRTRRAQAWMRRSRQGWVGAPMALGRGFYSRGERWACTRAAHLRHPVFQSDASPHRVVVKVSAGAGIRHGRWGDGRVERMKRRLSHWQWATRRVTRPAGAPARTPVGRVWIGCAEQRFASRRMKNKFRGRGWAEFSASAPPNSVYGPLGGRVVMLLTLEVLAYHLIL